MTEKQNDPLKVLFKMLPQVEPPIYLREQILNRIHSPQKTYGSWLLKPALALASFIVVSLFGTLVSIQFVSQFMKSPEKSAVLRWTQTETSSIALAHSHRKEI